MACRANSVSLLNGLPYVPDDNNDNNDDDNDDNNNGDDDNKEVLAMKNWYFELSSHHM
jgi:hypothetical protein